MNGGRRFLTASVISVQNSNFVYPSCQNCYSRLCLDLKRYTCLKCGCSGDAREASYRYRLSLEVADAHEVFLVTVFGSCLEAFFGVPAKSLRRYIEDLNSEVGEATGDASPQVVIQAVETCFVGKKFIFGVKDSERHEGARRCPKALTARQVFVPNPGLVGCTVLHYLNQHQCSSRPKIGHEGARSPCSLFAALDQPSGEFSGLYSSGDWDTVPSGHPNCLSNLWPQSFGLTSSSISEGTAVDHTAFSRSRPACDERQWDHSPISLPHHNQSIGNSQDDSLTVSEGNVQEDDKLCLCSIWHDGSFVTKDARSHSSEGDDCRLLQSPTEKGKKDSHYKISIQSSRALEKSSTHLQGYPFCPLISCAGHSRNSPGGPWFGDELPSSEDLNEFIARIEKDKTMVSPTETRARGHLPSQRAGGIRGYVIQPPPQLDEISATRQAHKKPQEVAQEGEESEEPILSCHHLNWPSLSGKEYQPGDSFGYLSTRVKKEWEHLPSRHQILSLQISPIGIKPSTSKGSHLSSEEGDQETIDCGNHYNSSSLKKTPSNCHKSPAHLRCKQECNVTSRRKKLSSPCELNQTYNLTNTQGQSFISAAHGKQDKVCRRQPVQESHKNHCKGDESDGLHQDSSIVPQAGYDASADLFDANATGVEAFVEMLNLTLGGALNAKSVASERKPSESEASWIASQNSLAFLDMFVASGPKASTPVAGPAIEPEHSPSSSQDFVPSSQSTPCVRPRQQAWLPRRRESVLRELPLNRWPCIEAKWKRPWPAFTGPLVKQLFNKILQSKSTNMSCAAADTSGSALNGSPTQEPSENDNEEWIPPSEKKLKRLRPLQNEKLGWGWDLVEKSPFSEKQIRRTVPRDTTGLSRTEFKNCQGQSKCLQSRSSNMSYSAVDTSVTPGSISSGSPAQEPSENDIEEWIPPSEKKWQPQAFQNQKTFGSRMGRGWDLTEKSPFPEKQTKQTVPKDTTGLSRTECTPKSWQPTEASIREYAADPQPVMVASPRSCAISGGSRLALSSTPRCTPKAVNWSPELFGDNSQLFAPEATL